MYIVRGREGEREREREGESEEEMGEGGKERNRGGEGEKGENASSRELLLLTVLWSGAKTSSSLTSSTCDYLFLQQCVEQQFGHWNLMLLAEGKYLPVLT